MKRFSIILAAILALATAASQAQSQSTHPMFHVEVTGHGAPMIFIPGLASSGATWDSTVAHYAKQYQCHVLTLAGFAGEPAVPGFSLEKVRDQISEYIAANRLAPAIVVGHSLGGDIALWLAAEHPEQVSKLVIVDSLPALGAIQNPNVTPEQLHASAEKMRQNMLNMPEEARLKMAKQAVTGMATNEADVNLIYGWSQRTDPKTEANAISDLMELDLRNEVGKIKAPTLVLGTWIAYSAYATQDEVRQTFVTQYKKLDGVQIELAPKARHFIMYDDPQWMFTQMDHFLGNKVKQ